MATAEVSNPATPKASDDGPGLAVKLGLPLALAALAVLAWDVAVAWKEYGRAIRWLRAPQDIAREEAGRGLEKGGAGTGAGSRLIPRPHEAALGLVGLAREGVLHRFIIASLFRVTWGFVLAALVGIPLGLAMGWWAAAHHAFNPFIQFLRPISPIAWIPLAILWFGLTEWGPIFLIFYSSVFPITVSTAAAVRNIQPAYVRAARNFGVGNLELFRRVILPATLPQILTGLRIALGIAWLVVVAAEMIVTDARIGGLGFQIMDVRNSGNRYDGMVAAMAVIGLIGLLLDLGLRQLENFDEVRWGYGR